MQSTKIIYVLQMYICMTTIYQNDRLKCFVRFELKRTAHFWNVWFYIFSTHMPNIKYKIIYYKTRLVLYWYNSTLIEVYKNEIFYTFGCVQKNLQTTIVECTGIDKTFVECTGIHIPTCRILFYKSIV